MLEPRTDALGLPHIEPLRRRLFREAAMRSMSNSSLAVTDESLMDYARRVNPTFVPHRMAQCLIDVCEKVASGELRRVMIFAPSRMGKSEPVTRIFSSWYVRKFPSRTVCISSYGAHLAGNLSQGARDYYLASGGELDLSSRAKSSWSTAEGGGVFSGGVRGPLLGHGYHVGILDDPHKNYSEAVSGTYQEATRSWWQKVFYSRQQARFDAAIIAVMQRWDEDDLGGWLLQRERESEIPERWHVVCLPELYDPKATEWLPESCTVEPDWRTREGEPLCPEMRSLEESQRRRANVDDHTWFANHQQSPERVVASGRVLHALKPGNVIELDPPGKTESLLVGLDFNVTPMCAVVLCHRAGQLHQVAEVVEENTNTKAMCRELKRLYPKNPITVYPDMYGVGRRTVGNRGETDYTIIDSEGLGRHHWDTRNRPSHKDRANEVNRVLGEPGGIQACLFIDPSCEVTVEALKKVRWKPGTVDEIDKTQGWDHPFDALSFPVHALYPIGTGGRDAWGETLRL